MKLTRWAQDALDDAESKGEDAFRALKARLVVETMETQQALSEDKIGMMADRADFMADGMKARDAQVAASRDTDFQWRSRAVFAVSVRQRMIAHINGRLVALQAARQGKKTPAGQPQRICVAIAFVGRSLEQTAECVQSWLDDGWSTLGNSIVHPDGVVLVLRKDF